MGRKKGGTEVIKGIGKRVVVVKSPDPKIFEEAIFIIREDFFNRSEKSQDEIIKEAERAADSYLKSIKRKAKVPFLARLSGPFLAALGAAATGITLLAVKLIA